MRKQKDFYGAKPRTSSAASEKRTSTSTSRPTSAGAKPYSQVKETAPKASKPQNPVNTPVQPNPRMPLLKKRAHAISNLSFLGAFGARRKHSVLTAVVLTLTVDLLVYGLMIWLCFIQND